MKYQKPKFLESPLATGVVGTIVSIFLFACYAWFKSKVLPNGGANIKGALSWFTPLNFSEISRDYYDVVFMLIATVIAMIGWEKFRQQKKTLIIYSIFSAFCFFLFYKASMGAQIIIPTDYISILTFPFTRVELILVFYILSSMIYFSIYAAKKYSKIRLDNGTNKSWKWAINSGFWRWLAIFSIISMYMVLVLDHPYWQTNNWGNWRISMTYIWMIAIIFGLPYSIFTQKYRASLKEDRSDTGLMLISIYKSAWQSIKSLSMQPFFNRFTNRKIRIACMDIFVKGFFLPIMFSGVYSELGGLFGNYPKVILYFASDITKTANYIYNNIHIVLWSTIMTTDIVIGAIGYACSSRWLDNKSKSVDLTLFGWVVALSCYPPFNSYTGSVFPFKSKFGGAPPEFFANNPELLMALKIIMLVSFVVFAWATMSFGLKFSNMTNRGIIKNGPYAIVRHPAYVAKTVGWWCMFIHTFSSPWHYVALAMFNGMYYLRAITEENHLMMDPEYQEYAKHVKWRFIPGVI